MGMVPAQMEMLGWVFMASFLTTALFLWLAGLPYHRLPREAHWSERARLLFLPRITFALILIWVPMGAGLTLQEDWLMGKGALLGLGLTAFLGCLLGEKLGMWDLDLPPAARTPRPVARLARVLILMPGVVVMLGMMVANAGRPLDGVSVGGSVLACLLLLGWQAGWFVWVCRRCGLLRPARPEIVEVVAGMSAKQGIPVRGVFEIDLGMWNAFAMIWTRDLAFTPGLLGGLNRAELEAITAHELGHLAEGPRMRLMRQLAFVPLGIWMLFPSLMQSLGLFPGLLVMAAAFLFSRFLGKWVRRAEVDADAVAMAEAREEDPGCYARVLERLYQENLMPAVLAQRTTHPDLYDRMVSAGVTPGFPRPLPARKAPGVVLALLAAVLAVVIIKLAVPDPPPRKHGRSPHPTEVRPEPDEVDS